MRPVIRGECPRKADGTPEVFSAYGHARPYLIRRIGAYCSFCEVKVSTPIDVEHIRHKDNNPALECEWENFLLACTNCNSTKGTKVDTKDDVDARMWPHTHRTFDVFQYKADGIIELAPVADPIQRARAEATAKMVGLFRRPGHGLRSDQLKRGSDRRYQERATAWQQAEDALRDLGKIDTPEVRRLIITLASASGFWSVWMTVFASDPAMRVALCEAFRGTAVERVRPPPANSRPSPATVGDTSTV